MLAQCTKARVGLSRPARAARSAHPGLQIRPLYNSCILRTVCRAQPENPEPTESKQTKELNALLDQLKKQGLDKTKAKAVLRKWEELGVKDSEQLRKLLIRRSLRPAIGIGRWPRLQNNYAFCQITPRMADMAEHAYSTELDRY